MSSRPPVVTILGHVDHGKTTLLDFIKKSQIASKEHGGITQRIGGYEVATGIKGYQTDKITFIDTPGHEAFSFLRARGADVADIALLIIDAKDSVMPQTIESISHIKTAKIPYIIVLNKTDLPEANPEKVKRDLLKHEVITEDKGGKVPTISISAKTGKGVKDLLETILLITADLNLTFDENKPPFGYVIETKKDRRGIVLSVILRDGQIKVGDDVYSDEKKARVRSITNDLGLSISQVQPSTPFELLGFSELPAIGSQITGQPVSKEIEKNPETKTPQAFDMDNFLNEKKEVKKLAVIIKADSQGSLQAIINSLAKNVNVDIILQAVGDVHKSDIFLAKTSKAIVVGFNIKIDPETKDIAKQEKVIIKTYNIIYELLDELNEVADLLKEKEEKEKNLKGEAKILASFIIENEKVYGIRVHKGKLNLGDQLQVFRSNKLIGQGRLVSLQIRAKKAAEIKKDQEAGVILSPALDIKVGDMVKSIL